MNTYAVIVTYGDRFSFLREVIESCFKNNIFKIIIADNNSHINSKIALKKYKENYEDKIEIILLNNNIGSAGGYKIGLKKASDCEDCDFILLLDDDNVLQDSTDKLIDIFQTLTEKSQGVYDIMLSCNRVNQKFWKIRKNTYNGFHIIDIPKKIFRFLHFDFNRGINIRDKQYIIELISAQYGGLFFKKEILSKLGLPIEDFVLYCDDTEFTLRFSNNKGKIFFIPDVRILDLQSSFGGEKRLFAFMTFLHSNESKTYYAIRNGIFLEDHYKKNFNIIKIINKTFYLFFLKTVAFVYGFLKKDKLINEVFKEAIKDGLEGNLGYNKKFQLK